MNRVWEPQKVRCEFGKMHEVYATSEVFEPYQCTKRKKHGGNKNVDRPKTT